MTQPTDSLDPNFVTVLADMDGFARWVVRFSNFDTGNRPIELLIVLHPDGDVNIATRPPWDSVSWSPPYDAQRR